MAHTKDEMSAVARAAETARDYVEHAGEQFREGCSQVAERTREGYRRAGDVVRHHPGRSVASAFGAWPRCRRPGRPGRGPAVAVGPGRRFSPEG